METTMQTVGTIRVTDVSGQKTVEVEGVASDQTVDEVVARLLEPMRLPRADADGRPLSWAIRSDLEGRILGGNERMGDVAQPGETFRMLPNVDAGRGGRLWTDGPAPSGS